MVNFSIGVDLGGTNLRIAAIDQQGQLLEKVTLGTQVSLGPDFVIGEMCTAIQHLRDKYQNSAHLQGIGIGVPGIIDMKSGEVRESPNLAGWANYPVHSKIEQRLGTRVFLENDANSAALGEKWLGAACEMNDMAMLTLGTGVGGGLVLGGRIWHGMTGMAGEFGHITIEPKGALCGCGNYGCLEQYASATAVMRMAKESIASGKPSALSAAASSDSEFSAKVVYNLAIQGDKEAKAIFAQVGRALGIAPYIFEELRQRSMVYAATAPPSASGEARGASANVGPAGSTQTLVTRALLGSDAGLYGAARVAQVLTA